jgi:hypothetical protein
MPFILLIEILMLCYSPEWLNEGESLVGRLYASFLVSFIIYLSLFPVFMNLEIKLDNRLKDNIYAQYFYSIINMIKSYIINYIFYLFDLFYKYIKEK